MRFLNAVQWGFLHNAPVIVLLVAAVWYWAQEKKALSTACAMGGALARPLVVRFAGPVVSGTNEPLEVTIVNIISMGLLQLLLAAYLGTEANWSNWKVDLGLGSLAGLSLAVAQGLVWQGVPVMTAIVPSLALAAGGALAFVGIRKLKRGTLALALATAALLVAMMTLMVNAIDCLHRTQG
jgi:hypothetical protein